MQLLQALKGARNVNTLFWWAWQSNCFVAAVLFYCSFYLYFITTNTVVVCIYFCMFISCYLLFVSILLSMLNFERCHLFILFDIFIFFGCVFIAVFV